MVPSNSGEQAKWASLVDACLRGGLAIRYRTEPERDSRARNDVRIEAVLRSWSRARLRKRAC